MGFKLISFLGRGFYQKSGARGDYRNARYRFVNEVSGSVWLSDPLRHFAQAIFTFQNKVAAKPFDEVVILGTSGSMWDSLATSFASRGDITDTDFFYQIIEKVDQQSVTEELLQRFELALNAQSSIPVRLMLIPSAVDADSQSKILSQIESATEGGDQLYLDVTHGYRHLPMIGLAAASLLASTQKGEIVDIAYGALELTQDGATPVVSLRWILQLLKVLSGMSELSRGNSLRPLIACFPSGAERTALEDAAYKLDVMRIDEAALSVRTCLRLLEQAQREGTLPVELALVVGPLRDRLEQFSRHERTPRGLTQMAQLALEQDDYLRTAVFLAESVDLAASQGISGDANQDKRLKDVRNWLAHAGKLGTRYQDRDVRQLVKNRNDLRRFFRQHIDRLMRDIKCSEK